MTKNKEKAFSLTELMMVVAIIAMLSSMVIGEYDALTARAHRVEAQILLKNLNDSLKSYAAIENNGQLPSASRISGAMNEDASMQWVRVISEDFSTRTSCLTNNVLGFRVPDCRNLKYSYWLNVQIDPPVYLIAAYDNGRLCPRANPETGPYFDALIYCPALSDGYYLWKDRVSNGCNATADVAYRDICRQSLEL